MQEKAFGFGYGSDSLIGVLRHFQLAAFRVRVHVGAQIQRSTMSSGPTWKWERELALRLQPMEYFW